MEPGTQKAPGVCSIPGDAGMTDQDFWGAAGSFPSSFCEGRLWKTAAKPAVTFPPLPRTFPITCILLTFITEVKALKENARLPFRSPPPPVVPAHNVPQGL